MNHLDNAFSLSRETIDELDNKFAQKRKLAAAREQDLFGVFDEALTDEERTALKFLYSYMPLSDLANYDGAMFLSHVQATLRIRKETPWSDQVPDDLFLYFILPYRVNNENIDDSREQLFQEIYPRVKGLSMSEAVLETNHWCHEKANYIGNDIRTVSPLTLMRTALGRCGEQSTLAVAALRSIGIPARQVYTPRWAHCDSNHAWVEAWTGSAWQFLGACEPEPVLNQGWFRKPARRAMLVHTRVPSKYDGNEKVTFAKPWVSELNLLDYYAPNKTVTAIIKDSSGKPTQAKVDFQLYNFGELSTIVSLDTNNEGEASLSLGLGDVWIHAAGERGFGFAKLHVARDESVTITLESSAQDGFLELDMAPPPELPDTIDEVSQELAEANRLRVQEGARIRASYEATFLQEKHAAALAESLSLPADRVWAALEKARGNSREIAAFLEEQCGAHGELPLKLLESLNDKDMTDTFRETLEDHLLHSIALRGDWDDETFVSYIMCPRIRFEMLEPYRAMFQKELDGEKQSSFRAHPEKLFQWIGEWFQINEEHSHYKGMASPAGCYRLKVGDRISRDIMFVAIARSIGIPARLEPSDGRPQYLHMGRFEDVALPLDGEDATIPDQSKGFIRLLRDNVSTEELGYYQHFTLAKLVDGAYVTLSYKFGRTDMFDEPLEVLPGQYRLTTGTRLPDGTTLVHFAIFTVQEGETVETTVTMRQASTEIPVLAAADGDIRIEQLDGSAVRLGEAVKMGGAVLAWIEPDREPSKHLLRELGELKNELVDLGVPIFLVLGEEKRKGGIALPSPSELPETVVVAKDDAAYSELAKFVSCMPETTFDNSFPVVSVIDSNLSIRYFSTGYKLGIGREIVRTLKHIT